jgi:hypothetical protein
LKVPNNIVIVISFDHPLLNDIGKTTKSKSVVGDPQSTYKTSVE